MFGRPRLDNVLWANSFLQMKSRILNIFIIIISSSQVKSSTIIVKKKATAKYQNRKIVWQ